MPHGPNNDEESRVPQRLILLLERFPVSIPPLRQRPEDIPLLVRYFTQKYGRRMQKQIESIPTVSLIAT
jgi:transcriptional regulator with GAF, ATPase, and Fis domain